MADTQWPRYQVFLQEKPDAPHQDVGSVHATDPDMALMNARDVFVRRPQCISLWVVPAAGIFSRTAQELEEEQDGKLQGTPGEATVEPYHIFTKARSAGTQTRVGMVEAASPQSALQQAIRQYSGDRPPFAWWVFPDRIVCRSDPQDNPSLFDPALDKPFRLSTDFHTVSAMREIRSSHGT